MIRPEDHVGILRRVLGNRRNLLILAILLFVTVTLLGVLGERILYNTLQTRNKSPAVRRFQYSLTYEDEATADVMFFQLSSLTEDLATITRQPEDSDISLFYRGLASKLGTNGFIVESVTTKPKHKHEAMVRVAILDMTVDLLPPTVVSPCVLDQLRNWDAFEIELSECMVLQRIEESHGLSRVFTPAELKILIEELKPAYQTMKKFDPVNRRRCEEILEDTMAMLNASIPSKDVDRVDHFPEN